MKNLVIFAGSQSIQDENLKIELEKQFKIFLDVNKSNINKILF
jgi:hypothetical protein